MEAVKAAECGVDELCLVGSSGSHDNNLMGKRFLEVSGFKKPIKTPRAEEILETARRDLFGSNTLYIFSSRSGTTPAIYGAAKTVKTKEPNALTIAFTASANTPLAKLCKATIPIVGSDNAALGIGSTIVCLGILPLMAGILKGFYNWNRSKELLDLLKWASAEIPNLKEKHREETYLVARAISKADQKAPVYLAGNSHSYPLVEQAAWCFATELLGRSVIPVPLERVIMGPCEAMGETTTLICLENDDARFVRPNYRQFEELAGYPKLVIPEPDLSGVKSGVDFKKIVGAYVQITLFYSSVENVLVQKVNPYGTTFYGRLRKNAILPYGLSS